MDACSRKKIKLDNASKFLEFEEGLSNQLSGIKCVPPVAYIYNPLEYAWNLHSLFINKYMSCSSAKVMYLGMNPGPWGMAQNGIPFGEHEIVRSWFEITEGSVRAPGTEHPAKKILGLDNKRSEISGKRFWSLMQKLCGTPQQFFKNSFVYNFCPLIFMDKSAGGKNITPDKLQIKQRQEVLRLCRATLQEILEGLHVEIIVGIGKFAEKEAKEAVKKPGLTGVKVFSIPHPSPINPKNTNWAENTEKILEDLNLMQYLVQ